MAQPILAFAIVLLGLTATQVGSYIRHKDVWMVERPLTSIDRCYNTTEHPTLFSDCEAPPFPVLDKSYEVEKTDVSVFLIKSK